MFVGDGGADNKRIRNGMLSPSWEGQPPKRNAKSDKLLRVRSSPNVDLLDAGLTQQIVDFGDSLMFSGLAHSIKVVFQMKLVRHKLIFAMRVKLGLHHLHHRLKAGVNSDELLNSSNCDDNSLGSAIG